MTAAPLLADRVTMLRHGRIEVALHRLRDAASPGLQRPLLLLHGLGERTPPIAPDFTDDWPGPVYGLDFTGHGHSTVPRGGGYTAEMLLGDADVAAGALGELTVVGRGLGAYIALLLCGARATQVHGAVLCDGPGLAGGGVQPGSAVVLVPTLGLGAAPDPFAMIELARDVRPPDYALTFVRFALESAPVPDPLTVCCVVRPEWLAAVAAEPGVVSGTPSEALGSYRPR